MDEAQPDYIISDLWPLIVGIDEVQIDPSNAMMHDEANLAQIAGSLNKHKQRKPIVINRATGTIEAGNGTLLAARRLGWRYIAAVGEEDDAQTAVSYGIADNAVASQAWDWERLKKHLDTFDAPGEVPGVDDELLATLKEALAAEELKGKKGDVPPQVNRAAELQLEYGTEVGQIWRLGEHRLAVGDCTDRAVVERVMDGEKADACITDPPYGVLDEEWDRPFNQDDFNSIKVVTNGLIAIFNAAKPEILLSMLSLSPRPERVGVWRYSHIMPTSGMIWSWQPVFYWNCKDIVGWDSLDWYQGNADRDGTHPTQKPIEFFGKIMKQVTGEFIYDPFLGSGTALIACENLGRRCRGIEIDPGYAAVTLRRWEELTGEKAEKIENG